MKAHIRSLIIGASALLLLASGAMAADEKAVEGVAEFVSATTVAVRNWKSAWFCDASSMQSTVAQCRAQSDILKSAAGLATLGMKAPLAALEKNLAALSKEFPESHGVRCRNEWIDLIGCHAGLGIGAISLRAALRRLEAR